MILYRIDKINFEITPFKIDKETKEKYILYNGTIISKNLRLIGVGYTKHLNFAKAILSKEIKIKRSWLERKLEWCDEKSDQIELIPNS